MLLQGVESDSGDSLQPVYRRAQDRAPDTIEAVAVRSSRRSATTNGAINEQGWFQTDPSAQVVASAPAVSLKTYWRATGRGSVRTT